MEIDDHLNLPRAKVAMGAKDSVLPVATLATLA